MENIKLTPEQIGAVVKTAIESLQQRGTPIKSNIPFVNRTAARILFEVGKADTIQMAPGISLEKAYNDYYGISLAKAASDYTGANAEFSGTTDWRRTGFLDESQAKIFWDFVRNESDPFMKRITILQGTKQPMPIDMWGIIPENLISSTRSGSQPGTHLKKQLAKFGKELLARHFEMQFDLKFEEIVNALGDPGFEARVFGSIMVSYGNDILRLWTNGTSYAYNGVTLSSGYTHSNMYLLAKGWLYKLQNSCGTFTNTNQNSMVLGVFGKEITANKYAISAISSTVSKWAPTHADTSEYIVPTDSDATLSIVATAQLKVLKGTTGTVCYARKSNIEVVPNKNCTLTYSTINEATASSYVEVFDNEGNLLGASAPNTTEAITVHTLNFFTRNTNFIYIKLHSVTNSKYTYFSVITLTQNIGTHTGADIIDIMNELYTLRRIENRSDKGYCFIMGYDDLDKYATEKLSPIKLVSTGAYVGVNNTMRETWTVEGNIPMHKGHEVLPNPYMHSISDAVSYGGTSVYGSIVFGNPKDLFGYGLVGNFPTSPLQTKEFKARHSGGGAMIEFTNHAWTDAELAPDGKFSIAFQGAKCETPVLKTTDAPKSADCVSATTTAVDGCVPYCDTPGARIFMTLTANVADIATIDLAVAGVTAGDVFELTEGAYESTSEGNSALTAAAWSFAAFKDGIVLRSSVTACTFA